MTRLATGLVFLGMATPIYSSQGITVPSVENRATTKLAARAATIPVGTPLLIQSESNVPLRVGQSIRGRLVYPVDAGNVVVIPQGASVTGKIISLQPDNHRRMESRLRGDFTPFRKAIVDFDEITFPGGGSEAIATTPALDGAKVIRLVPPPSQKGGLFRRELGTVFGEAKNQIAVFTGPDKRDRLVQFLYTQMPYHPQRLNKGVSWTVETTEPFTASESRAADVSTSNENSEDQRRDGDSQIIPWMVQAHLQEPLSSATSSVGSSVRAIVAEPIFAPDHTVSVPQGAMLLGAITQAHPAGRFGKAGVLQFDFKELVFPDTGATEHVQASLKGIDAADGNRLAIDSEGKATSKTQDKLAVPLTLLVLAARPLDSDHGDSAFGKDAAASNSLGLIGFVLGTAGGWRNIAAGFGYYGAALSIYNRWIKRGSEITFPKHTRIVVQMTVRASKSLSEVTQ